MAIINLHTNCIVYRHVLLLMPRSLSRCFLLRVAIFTTSFSALSHLDHKWKNGVKSDSFANLDAQIMFCFVKFQFFREILQSSNSFVYGE